ncbi:MAG: hypothetical protein JRH15_00660 [Deltaproteobacteria bacterium]|nr:hypothetical protein [Deltaproteobacteria bacterium]
MYDLVRGPLVWVSFIVFMAGTVFQIIRFYTLSRKAGFSPHVPTIRIKKATEKTPLGRKLVTWLRSLKMTVLGVHPVTITVSTIFHICLFITPIFLLGHNELFDLSWGLSLAAFSETVTDVLTLIFLACCAYFLLRRIFLSRVRSITSFYDYLVLAIAIAPFLTGFLAYHQIYDYRTMMIIHMLCGEIMLMAIPFTKLVHMIFFFLNRFMVVNEHTLGQGSRAW